MEWRQWKQTAANHHQWLERSQLDRMAKNLDRKCLKWNAQPWNEPDFMDGHLAGKLKKILANMCLEQREAFWKAADAKNKINLAITFPGHHWHPQCIQTGFVSQKQ
jgi:hypothetical protein